MWRMLQQESPEDFVLATGETTTVRKFVELAFHHVGLKIRWEGNGVSEKGIGPEGEVLVEISPQFFRPTEVDLLLGNATKAKDLLGWTPKTSLGELVKIMVDADQKNQLQVC